LRLSVFKLHRFKLISLRAKSAYHYLKFNKLKQENRLRRGVCLLGLISLVAQPWCSLWHFSAVYVCFPLMVGDGCSTDIAAMKFKLIIVIAAMKFKLTIVIEQTKSWRTHAKSIFFDIDKGKEPLYMEAAKYNMALRNWEESRGTLLVLKARVNELVADLSATHVLLVCLFNNVNLPSQEMPPYSSAHCWTMDEAKEEL
jgi:hypothetical protein